jgi:hypothetical protein
VAVRILIHIILISVIVAGEWSASRSGRFKPGKSSLGTLWIGSWFAPVSVWTIRKIEDS